LLSELSGSHVDTSAVVHSSEYRTIVKTRIVSQGQQIVRLDYERRSHEQTGQDVEEILRAVTRGLEGVNAVIVSDYGKGFFHKDVIDGLIAECRRREIPVFVDPKGRDFTRYRGAHAITPNSREAHEATGIQTSTEEGLSDAADAISGSTGCPLVVITRGADGLAIRNSVGHLTMIPTSAREVFDVTGAGDTFVAWLTLGVAAGLSPEESAALANTAAGIAVARTGPAVVSPLDIRQALAPGRLGKKIVSEYDLAALGKDLHQQGKSIVLTNGCFDFLHAGHVAFLQQAKNLGDVLVLATNCDETIQRLKGERRPVIAQRQREELLASIEAVDYVTVFSGDTPHEVIRQLQPDVLVKGSNYRLDQVEGAELVKASGGRVETLPILHDFHTGQLIGEK
jgi:D-beta-D-heptose 7-phosphate kinase/D-beta-D-heptose 1-phosphate adenosyltransferase